MAGKLSKKLSIVVKSFMRKDMLMRCIFSICVHFPLAARYIEKGTDNLSKGRNILTKLVKTPYLLLCDDDYVMVPQNNIERVVEVMRKKDMDIVCGRLYQDGKPIGHEKRLLTIRGAVRKLNPRGEWQKIDGLKFKRIDMGLNFFVAKTKIFKKLRWDKNCPINTEHLDFFLTAKKLGIKVYYCPDMIAIHDVQTMPKEYQDLRDRTDSYGYFAKKWKINKCVEGDIITNFIQ